MDWIDIITRVGFPIAMVMVLCWYVKTKDDRSDDRIDKIISTLTEELRELKAEFREIKAELKDLLRKED